MKHILITTIAAVLLVGCGPGVDIHQAARTGNIEAVKQHLAAGANVSVKDEDGDTPLHEAAFTGRKEVVELLIANGADLEAQRDGGWTPLHNAAQEGHMEVVELLIANGADVNAKSDDGRTPLDSVKHIRGEELEVADILRKHGGKTGEELKAEGK